MGSLKAAVEHGSGSPPAAPILLSVEILCVCVSVSPMLGHLAFLTDLRRVIGLCWFNLSPFGRMEEQLPSVLDARLETGCPRERTF